MNNDLTFYQKLKNRLELEPVAVATIVEVVGSAPREVGAKIAVCSDRSIIGTIGGGAGEGKVIERALTVLETGEKQFIEIDLTGAPGKDIQGVCGGKVQVWLEKWSGEQASALVSEILEVLSTGQTAQLITPFLEDAQPYLTASSVYPKDVPWNVPTMPPCSSAQFSETIQPPPILLIVGGGHVAVSLAQIASFAGFQIAVQDDRPEFITDRRFPQAAYLFPSLDTALDSLRTHSQLYVALVTRGFPQDVEALQTLVDYSLVYKYVGAIGSQKRIRMIQQKIPTERLANFYAPIGLDIGALTPEEIAVSICGELIKVRRSGTGLSLSERMQHPKTPLKVHLTKINNDCTDIPWNVSNN